MRWKADLIGRGASRLQSTKSNLLLLRDASVAQLVTYNKNIATISLALVPGIITYRSYLKSCYQSGFDTRTLSNSKSQTIHSYTALPLLA